MVGKASRVAQVVPAARPFVGALWAALTASQRSRSSPSPEASPGDVAVRRFCPSACWLRALIKGDGDHLMDLERLVWARGPAPASVSSWSVRFDASTTGAGGVLYNGDQALEHWSLKFDPIPHLDVIVGSSKCQSFWGSLALLVCLMIWGNSFVHECLAVLGDNTSALQNAQDFKGRREILAVNRELAWRAARFGWAFEVGHVPTEKNLVADALSRMWDKVPSTFPAAALASSRCREPPRIDKLWRTRTD